MPSGAPPEIDAVQLPPSAARSLPYTSRSNSAWRARSSSDGPPVSWALLHSIAVRAASSKILPLPASRAFNSAVLYTFSNTRGTDTTTVGLNTPSIGTRFLMSLV